MFILIFAISIISFIIINLPPGDYLTTYVSNLEQQGVHVSQQMVERLRQRYGLGHPMHIRYFIWMRGIFRGDFGQSFYYERPVMEILMERIPLTVMLSMATLIFEMLVAIPIGIYSAVRKYSISDYFATIFGFVGLATPNFLLALVLMFSFYHWFGVSIGGLFSPEFQDAPWTLARFWDMFKHMWVPMIVIGTAGTAGTIRVLRAMMLDELGKDYVKLARSKGMSEWQVIIKHPVRIALNPIISTIGWLLPAIISGEAIVSIVLNLPTTGPVLINSLQTQDMYLAGSFILILSTLTIIGTLISDILLAVADPRVRYEENN